MADELKRSSCSRVASSRIAARKCGLRSACGMCARRRRAGDAETHAELKLEARDGGISIPTCAAVSRGHQHVCGVVEGGTCGAGEEGFLFGSGEAQRRGHG